MAGVSAAWARALPEAAALARRAARAALKEAGSALPPGRSLELGIRLSDDAELHALNRAWRGQDKPTNVLSFASDDANLDAEDLPLLLGDVVLALERVLEEAAEQGKRPADHFSHLVVHGVLHLLGFDHVKTADAAVMEPLEVRVLAGLGIADPYVLGASPSRARARR